jgi:glycosyltransferase involved in cell wall biosynthesis
MRGATVLLPWGAAAAEAIPAAARGTAVVPLHVPVDAGASGGAASPGGESARSASAAARDVDALAYAGYPEKRGLDALIRAWATAGAGRRLVVAGIDRERGEAWLAKRGITVPASVEWRGLLDRPEWEALLRRSRMFVNASRREDHGLSQLEALAAGCMLVTVPSAGPYEALPIARRLGFVADDLADALAMALGADADAYAQRAAQELEPYRRDSVQRVFEEQVLPALGLR